MRNTIAESSSYVEVNVASNTYSSEEVKIMKNVTNTLNIAAKRFETVSFQTFMNNNPPYRS